MSQFEEDNIDPSGWTQRELLKHVYREVLAIKEKMENDTSHAELEKRVTDIERTIDVWEGKRKTFLWVWGVVMSALVVIVNWLIKVFS